MQFGYFDNENREYVITNPKTPAPWANYLGSPEYGAIISIWCFDFKQCRWLQFCKVWCEWQNPALCIQ